MENLKQVMVDPGVVDMALEMSTARGKGLETKPFLKMTMTRANMVVLETNTDSEANMNLKADTSPGVGTSLKDDMSHKEDMNLKVAMGPKADTSLKDDMSHKEDMNLKVAMGPKADTSLKDDMGHKEDMNLRVAIGLAMSTALGLGTLHRADTNRTTTSVMVVVDTDIKIQNVVATQC
jgi:hypothetical protein